MCKKLILITIILLILISGCGPTNNTSNEQDFHKGISGLTIEFLKNTPPPRIFEGDNFPVIITVKNNGAYSLKEEEKAILSLGVEKDYTKSVNLLQGGRVQLVQTSTAQGITLEQAAAFSLNGRSQTNSNGDEEIISYNIGAAQVDPQSEYHQSSVIVTLCYPYETVLAKTICIDTDVNNLRPSKKVCNAQDLILNDGQGAPVAITKIEVSMLPAQVSDQKSLSEKIRPQFLIYVENKGPGLVIKTEAVKDFCTKSDTVHENFNIVYVDAELSGRKLKCQLEKKEDNDELGHIKLKDKKDIIRCSTSADDSAYLADIDRNIDSYLSPLKITLKYGYTQTISTNYLIEKLVS